MCLMFSFSRLPKWLHVKITVYYLLNLLVFYISFLFCLVLFLDFFCNFLPTLQSRHKSRGELNKLIRSTDIY